MQHCGFLNVNKPAGPSSSNVVQRVRAKLGRDNRVGHCGTLDPAATGVLVLALGPATRLVEYLLHGTKEYRATVRLGISTDTYDLAGTVTAERPVPALTDAQLEAGLAEFRGKIMQSPPPVSALKRGGEPLYAKVRRGETVHTDPRPAEFMTLEKNGFDGRDLSLRAVCAGGTYLRSLAHDLGAVFGCGGTLAALTRTRVGEFTLAGAVALAELEAGDPAALIIPAETVLQDIPRADLAPSQALQVLHGGAVTLTAAPGAELVRLFCRDRLLAIAAVTGKMAQPKKVLLTPEDFQ